MPENRIEFRCSAVRPNRIQAIDFSSFIGKNGGFWDAKTGIFPELREGVSF
jgi:hypothetical protein